VIVSSQLMRIARTQTDRANKQVNNRPIVDLQLLLSCAPHPASTVLLHRIHIALSPNPHNKPRLPPARNLPTTTSPSAVKLTVIVRTMSSFNIP